MKIFSIQTDGTFMEYVRIPFQAEYEESVLEEWLESNPDGILEDGGVLIIGRQVATNLGGSIDLLGLDREGNAVVVELKRDRTPRETIAQSLEYASFVAQLDAAQLEGILSSYLNEESSSLTEYHRQHFDPGMDESVTFNKDQHIVVIGQFVTRGIKQTASFLRSKGIKITCVEFTLFQDKDGKRLMSQDIVVGQESMRPAQVSSTPRAVITEDEFLANLDDNGRSVFSRILQFAAYKSMPIHWGTKGFSLNVNLNGTHIATCFGYPPNSVWGQSLDTRLHHSSKGLRKQTAVSESTIRDLRDRAESTGLFGTRGKELRCHITRRFTDAEIDSILAWIEAVETAIREHGLARKT